jgi:hypothetical protein
VRWRRLARVLGFWVLGFVFACVQAHGVQGFSLVRHLCACLPVQALRPPVVPDAFGRLVPSRLASLLEARPSVPADGQPFAAPPTPLLDAMQDGRWLEDGMDWDPTWGLGAMDR